LSGKETNAMIYPTNGLYLAEQNPDLRVQDARADTSAMMKRQRDGPPWFAAAIIEHETHHSEVQAWEV
jgi:hypothetical protein